MTVSAPKKSDATADAALAVPVWDLPVRLTHWGFVLLIAFSWWSAENGRIQWHLWSGFGVLFLLLFRLLWGVLGSSTARFASFVTGPRKLRDYLRNPAGWTRIGHTPLGALSILALLGLMGLQVGFGLPLSDEDGTVAGPLNRLVGFEFSEWAHDIHETLFNVLLAAIAVHVAAILYYRLRGKRLLGPMIRGSSRLPAGTEAMIAAPSWRLLPCLLVAGAITGWVASGVPGL